MLSTRHVLCGLAAALLLAACGKKAATNQPLAFVPADSPYVLANIEPTPLDVTKKWSEHMHQYWSVVFDMYDKMLDQIASKHDAQSSRAVKIAHVLLGEIRSHDSWDKLRTIGLKPDAHFALYGFGMVPVLRYELGDAAAFKNEIAHIEQLAGETMPEATLGKQSYWKLTAGKVEVMLAIEGNQFVATFAPVGASDTLKQSLLGLTRPSQSLVDSGGLETLAKKYRYAPYGEGYIDFTRLVDRFTKAPTGNDLEIAKLLGLPTTGTDAVCQGEYAQIAQKMPRLAFGIEEMTPARVRFGMQMEMDPALARELMQALIAAPGTGAAAEGVVDMSVALPLLKFKDFWIARADAVAAKPFACDKLKGLNSGFAQMKAKLGVTIPPPLSDLTGVRVVLDSLQLKADGKPDMSGRALFASNNPGAALAMAQLTVPALKDFKLAPDGKAVALPAGIAPAGVPPLYAAMSDKAIAIGAGTGEDARLKPLLDAPAANQPVFLRIHGTGKIYDLLAEFMNQAISKLPANADKAAQLQAQTKLFKMYATWIRSFDMTMSANAGGIAFEETAEQN